MKKNNCKEEDVNKSLSQSNYVNTRNKFSHGKELLLGLNLFECLPDSNESQTIYGITEEFFNPHIETISFIQLHKTLNFFIDYSRSI